ncbi:larval cuticle protein 9-like [Daphnia pulicaria]|uniref:larval cuticle protein 9-like n=1 Tax=Daphnia pulicaria TaxID=35523 RepID=UPI001EEBEC5B|nr:larval cuticle protein 9-like [Daphnia pulicaria]
MQVQLILVSLVALAVSTSGEEQPKYTDTVAKSSEQQYAPMPHSFAWEVKDEPSKNDYSHQQESDGKVTTGSYRVALPDGRTQIVTYTADQNGYVAQVKYEGEAQYPAPSSYSNKPSASYPTEQAKPTTAYPVV